MPKSFHDGIYPPVDCQNQKRTMIWAKAFSVDFLFQHPLPWRDWLVAFVPFKIVSGAKRRRNT